MRERTSPGARLALVAVGVVGLLAVVGLASRGNFGGGGRSPAPSGSLLDYGFSIFMVLYLLALPVTLWVYLSQRRALIGSAGRRRRGRGLLVNLAVFGAFLGAAVALGALRHSHGRLDIRLPPAFGEAQPRKWPPATAGKEPRFRWEVAAAFAVLGAAGVAAYVVVRRRRGPLRAPQPLGEELAVALDDAIDDVRAESDPRRAVIKAYARMEAILGARGLPRRPAEAPYEYLARALETLAASAASVTRLTDLFERAKFSLHEIGAPMREEAIAALTAVRDELRRAA